MPRKAKGPNGETLPPGLYWDGKYFRIRPLPGYPRERAGKRKGRALQLLKERRAQIERRRPDEPAAPSEHARCFGGALEAR